uniref:PiggyBac transposable element-derived protein domain-containing protein n=1 Tax=Fundulus heteroclitus TaxID=8078 RepID=A0A3Q2SZ84_FUNHE
MDSKTFYASRTHNSQALIPEQPQDSDADLSSDDDEIEDPDYHPTQEEDETSFDSMFEEEEEEETPNTSSSSKPPPRKKRRKGKNTLKRISVRELDETLEQSTPQDPKKATRRIWKYEDIDKFHVPASVFEAPDAVKTPLQHFKSLFTDEMIQHIAHHTNLYSAQELGDPINCSPEEIEIFLAMLLVMGHVFTFPAMEDYWHHDSRYNLIADIMSRKRFKLLRRFIHFNDNYQFNNSPDRFYKICPLFEILQKQCLLISSSHKHSVDEVMVAFKGTRAGTLRQYIANKPDKWGFKLFCHASSSGITHDLLLYQGASTFFNVPLSEEEQKLPLGSKVVMTLSKTITEPNLSVVFCDNYFTSFDLIQNLHANLGVKCIGTVRSNRMGQASLMSDKLMKKGHGAFDFRSSEGVLAVKWFDNKCVNILSNACRIMPTGSVRRWSKDTRTKVDVPCPSLIPAYNQHMGGIDLSDMLVHMYKTPAKSRRWYFPLFGYILDLCISNAWLIHKRDCALLNEKPLCLKRFRLAVKRYTPRPTQPQPDVRYDNFGHLPLHCYKRGRCNLCPKGVSWWKCQKCNVFLCLNAHQQCFVAYHQK